MRRTLSPAGAFWLAAFTYFIWGFTFLASRIAQDYGTPFVLLFWRFALAFALLNLLRLTGRFPVRLRGRRLWPALLAGLFEPVLYFPCEQYGLKLTSTSFSGVMVALIPLCSLVYGAVFLHEKATWRQVVFSVLSVAGVIVLAVYATGIGAGSFLGFLVLLGTVFAGAGYMVACRACSGSFTAFERTYTTCGMGAAAFGVLVLLGFAAGMIFPDMAQQILQNFAAQIEQLGLTNDVPQSQMMATLFFNNITASLLSMLYGLIPFLPLSALALGTNALMLGAFAAIYQQQGIGLGVYVLGVLPHGIFELSALILSCALGLLICRTGTERILKKSDTPFFRRVLDCIRVFLTFSVPLLLVAALIETYVTPALLNLVL